MDMMEVSMIEQTHNFVTHSEQPVNAIRKGQVQLVVSPRQSCYAPLLPHESETEFQALLDQIKAACGGDIIVSVLAEDVAHLSWEIRRWQRAKNAWLCEEQVRYLHVALTDAMIARKASPTRVRQRAKNLIERWRRGEPEAMKSVESLLHESGLVMPTLLGQVIADSSDLLAQFERLISQAEHRRSLALQQISRWKDTLGTNLKQLSDIIEAKQLSGSTT
jgi:hypothetical protein